MAPAAKARKAVTIFSDQFRIEELKRRATVGTDISNSDLSKLTASAWKGLSTEEKAKFKRMEDKEREMFGEAPKEERAVKPKRTVVKDKEEKENQSGAKAKPVKKPKDPNAPKRPASSFFVFSSEQRPLLKATQPDLKVTEVAKEMGRRWKEMDAGMKKKYELIAEEDKKRYNLEFAAYEKNLAPPSY